MRQETKKKSGMQLEDFGIVPEDLNYCPRCRTQGLNVSGDKRSWDCSNCHWTWSLARQMGEKMIFDAHEIAPEIMRWHAHGTPKGASYGWPDLDPLLRARRGEWTMVTGWSGHGKSQLMDAVMVNMAAADGWKFGIFSPENIPYAQHIRGLIQKVSGKRFEEMLREEVLLALGWLKQHIHFIDTPEPTFETLLAQFWKLVKTKDIQGVIIDPWNEIEHDIPYGMNETQYVAKVLMRFRDFCKAAHVHGWILAHPGKEALKGVKKVVGQEAKRPVVGLLDISGSAHFENKPFNGVSVWRDPAAAEGDKHSNYVHVVKHRTEGVGGIGQVVLTWDPESTMYHSPEKPLLNSDFMLEALKARIDRNPIWGDWKAFAQRQETDWWLKVRPLPWARVEKGRTHFESEFRTDTTEGAKGAVWVDRLAAAGSAPGAEVSWWASYQLPGINGKGEISEHDSKDDAFTWVEKKLMVPFTAPVDEHGVPEEEEAHHD